MVKEIVIYLEDLNFISIFLYNKDNENTLTTRKPSKNNAHFLLKNVYTARFPSYSRPNVILELHKF